MKELDVVARTSIWTRLKLLYAFMRSQEPAALVAVWRALLGVAIAAGVTIPDWLDERVAAVIAAVYVVLALSQGLATRARVVPADNVARAQWSETQRAVVRQRHGLE